MIADVGLLTAKGLSCFYPVFKDWEHQVDPEYKQQYGFGEWLNTRPKFSDPSYVPKMVEVLRAQYRFLERKKELVLLTCYLAGRAHKSADSNQSCWSLGYGRDTRCARDEHPRTQILHSQS